MRMKEAMDKTLDEAWRKRAAGLPLANRREALTLASIIEKETAVPAERAKVAAVFINRLRRRMKLESDPTTIYGITGGKVPLNRELTRADLQSNSPYNTYVITGLPPGPICNPGRASILAATNPARDRALYFVADGQGGHAFAGDARRAQSQRRALAADPARARRAAAADADAAGRARRAVPGSARPAASGAETVSHAGHRPGPGRSRRRRSRHRLVPARQPVLAGARACAWSWSCWAPSASAAC